MALETETGAPLLVTAAARAHLEAHPTVWSVLSEAAARLNVPEDVNLRAFEVPFGRPLQLATKLAAPQVDLDTPTHFALRANRAHPSRVTQETPTTWDSSVVIWIRRSNPNSPLELASAFIGTLSPLEPWDPHLKTRAEFEISLEHWSRHALVHDSSIMQPPFTSTWREILRQAQSPFV